jgi:ribonuclease J
VGQIINQLIEQGIEVVTDRTHLVHVSGHPRRDEVAQLYSWVRPQILLPVHGEPLHIHEHALFAKAHGIPQVITAKDGEMVLFACENLAQETPIICDKIPVGKILRDGDLLVPEAECPTGERKKMAFAGVISVAVAINTKGDVLSNAEIFISGLPKKNKKGKLIDHLISDAVDECLETLPKAKRRDPETLEHILKQTIRGTVHNIWGKKPIVHALVVQI